MWSSKPGPGNVARRGAVAGLTLALCGAAATPATAKPTLAGWYLTEAADARSVWIAPSDSTIGYCNRLKVRTLRVTPSQIRLQLEATPKPVDPVTGCAVPAEISAPDRIRVRIPGGIQGRKLSGPRIDRKPIMSAFWSEWHPLKGAAFEALAAPRLIGLSARDATAVLTRIGLTSSANVSGPRGGEVTRQTPVPGEAFVPATAAFDLTTT